MKMAKANAKLVPCLAQYHIPGGLWLGLSCTGLLGDDFSTVQPESVTEGSALCSLSAADLHRIAIQELMFIRLLNKTHCQRLSSTAVHSSLQERQQN